MLVTGCPVGLSWDRRVDQDDSIPFPAPTPSPDGQACDFCGAPHPTWDYPTSAFEFTSTLPDGRKVIHHSPGGGWGACDACSACIELDDYEALAQRSVGMQMVRNLPPHLRRPRVEARVLAHTKAHYAHFRIHRTGPRVAAQKSL